MGIKDLIKKIKPLNIGDRRILENIKECVDNNKFNLIRDLLRQGKISLEMDKLNTSIVEPVNVPRIKALGKVDASEVNTLIRKKIRQGLFNEFKKKAFDIIPELIASNIVGLDGVKKAITLQLFSKQVVHVLLLGDPGTGKTDIIRSASEMHPISSFGLGSGTSGAGLVVTVKGKEIIPGLIPKANNGICCIDELNLMKEDSRAGLYNAMEKGFITYDKGGNHYQFDARVKIAATANPKGDEFKGNKIGELKKQLPFDPALLTRFHLVFLIRKPDIEKFKKIASNIVEKQKKINKDDIDFVKDYLDYSNEIVKDIEFSEVNKRRVVDFVAELKKNENKYLVEISPRIVIGIMRLCKALAKLELRNKVEKEDVERVKNIIIASLHIE